MLNNELLNEVLNYKKEVEIIDTPNEDADFFVLKIGEHGTTFDACTLANLCKQWATDKGFYIQSKVDKVQDKLYGYSEIHNIDTNSYVANFNGSTEYESIFKATRWIYNKLKNT